MRVALAEQRVIQAPPAAVFALALDSVRFPATFRGYGPIPALRRITPNGPPAVGATRAVESDDGAVLIERISAFEPPHRHAYTLTGLRAPLAWLVREGRADWSFAAAGSGTRVTWRYAFVLTSVLAWPFAFALLQVCMRGALRRCLAAVARELESG